VLNSPETEIDSIYIYFFFSNLDTRFFKLFFQLNSSLNNRLQSAPMALNQNQNPILELLCFFILVSVYIEPINSLMMQSNLHMYG